jgi:diaminohydroxyphosphoribosylaminopyrimidine deaminase/5-amino-6-(5-phosphoribosylamino)uracil reductase
VIVEGGPKVAASFVSAGLVDEAALLRGEKTIGAGGIWPLEGMPLDALTGDMKSHGTEKLGADVIESFART